MNLENLRKVDSQVAEQIDLELKRQQENIELIASENFTSLAVMEACGSVLTNKYAEGKPHKRYYNGCEHIDVIEEIAQKRACELFGMEHANVQPHSGAQANMAVFMAVLKPGDKLICPACILMLPATVLTKTAKLIMKMSARWLLSISRNL